MATTGITLRELGSRVVNWLLMAACFVGIPAMLISIAIDRYCQIVEHERGSELRLSLQQALNEASHGINVEHYIAQRTDQQLQQFDNNNAGNSEVVAWLECERTKLTNLFNYLVWDRKGRPVAHNLSVDVNSPEWHEVFIELFQSCYASKSGHHQIRKFKKIQTDLTRVRQLLGPQYVRRMAEDGAHPKFYSFGWPDSAMLYPMFWVNAYKNRVYLLLFDPAVIHSDVGIRQQIEQFAQKRKQIFGIFRPTGDVSGMWATRKTVDSELLLAQLQQMAHDNTTFIETSDKFLATAFLTPQINVFAVADKHYSSRQRILYSLAAIILFTALMLPYLIYTWRITVAGLPGTLMIRPRIAFIFFFASAVPFMAISIFAHEHYSQKHRASLKEAHRRSMVLLQNYDERMQSMWSRAEFNTQKYLEGWVKNMRGRELDQESNRQVADACRDLLVESYYLIASASVIAGTYNGVERLSESLEPQSHTEDPEQAHKPGRKAYRSSDTRNAQVANIIGKRVMNELNGEAYSTKEADRLELLFESLMQKSFAEITHSFIKAMGGLSPFGFGRTLNLSLLNFMSAGNNEKIDFMALMIWSSPAMQDAYLSKTIDAVNRNPLGLKVIACSQFQDRFYPSGYEVPEKLKGYFKRIVAQPAEEIDIIEMDGQEYMVLGFVGKHLSRYKLMGLYPIDRLDRMIAGQRTDLFLFALFCLILAAWLAQILSQSFLNPLNSLQEAAIAIEKRNFSHRTGELGKDEFGETAAIFDDVMVGLEELAVAKVVQESLFPAGALCHGHFHIYGKSLAMAELGGDYFDYFLVDDGQVAALLGDVAGHGVGAALIMAMAKAGIIKCRDQLKTPVKLLERLHNLIYSSKTRKQKKIMTFQYLTADCTTGKAVYSNAGGCSPIFCSNGRAAEITLAGAALGSFKKAKLQQLDIEFKSGDLLVFYTDGIIEARNSAGVELGYVEFARLVEKSAGPDPETVYNKICKGYYKHIAGMEAQDDLTLVVICYN